MLPHPGLCDLAPLLLAREIVHYRPSVVIMNGVATGKTHIPLRIELGSANTALAGRPDGSGLLTAEPLSEGASETTLFQSAPSVLPSYFPWRAARAAAHLAIAREQHAGTLSRAMAGVEFGRFPSEWLTYLCNNLVYVTNAWLDDPRDFRLLESSSSADEGIALPPRPHGHPILRTFIHWPDLPKSDHAAGARVLLAIAYATLRSRGDDEGPTLGDPANADS